MMIVMRHLACGEQVYGGAKSVNQDLIALSRALP